MSKLTMYEINVLLAKAIEKIDGAEVTNKGQMTTSEHCDIDFTYDDRFFHIDLKNDDHEGQSFFQNVKAEISKAKDKEVIENALKAHLKEKDEQVRNN